MPKGRAFAPIINDQDKSWFQHSSKNDKLNQCFMTTTGSMLTTPYIQLDEKLPQTKYINKHPINFKNQNRFSEHDNRHSFQDHGVYFGNGPNHRRLGKRINEIKGGQHRTDLNFLSHSNLNDVPNDMFNVPTNYTHTYQRPPSSEQHGILHRRFHRYNSANTVPAYGSKPWEETDEPQKTPFSVLGLSQEPFLPKNTWKYSYYRQGSHPLVRVKHASASLASRSKQLTSN